MNEQIRRPRSEKTSLEPEQICSRFAAWAEVTGLGKLAVWKSDLLSRMIYGREKGPSQTPCPVHKGHWSGCHFGWPGSTWVGVGDAGERIETPAEVNPQLQEWWDAGCRCATHKGSSCTTGWQPDEACGCVVSGVTPEKLRAVK